MSSLPQERGSKLFDIPLELRQMIYAYLLHTPNLIFISSPHCRLHLPPGVLDVKLLSTNKQIHQEGADILYDSNRFVFQSSSSVLDFFSCIGAQNVARISYIFAGIVWKPEAGTRSDLGAIFDKAVGLKTFRLGSRISMLDMQSVQQAELDLLKELGRLLDQHPKLAHAHSTYPRSLYFPDLHSGWCVQRMGISFTDRTDSAHVRGLEIFDLTDAATELNEKLQSSTTAP